MKETKLNGTTKGVHLAVIALTKAARALIEASAHANDGEACQLAVGTFSSAAELLGRRGLPDDSQMFS